MKIEDYSDAEIFTNYPNEKIKSHLVLTTSSNKKVDDNRNRELKIRRGYLVSITFKVVTVSNFMSKLPMAANRHWLFGT
ncbi:hypothetical protein IW01_18650 [Pectobacterium brasiliense]|nr:hypothetical protein IW01_18650 [Pectobacterium brasiliense]GLY59219.1 hypothetical protein Pcaca05_00770 [Pectobacterium carotovorum subsp. carotovorum]